MQKVILLTLFISTWTFASNKCEKKAIKYLEKQKYDKAKIQINKCDEIKHVDEFGDENNVTKTFKEKFNKVLDKTVFCNDQVKLNAEYEIEKCVNNQDYKMELNYLSEIVPNQIIKTSKTWKKKLTEIKKQKAKKQKVISNTPKKKTSAPPVKKISKEKEQFIKEECQIASGWIVKRKLAEKKYEVKYSKVHGDCHRTSFGYQRYCGLPGILITNKTRITSTGEIPGLSYSLTTQKYSGSRLFVKKTGTQKVPMADGFEKNIEIFTESERCKSLGKDLYK